MNKVGMAVVLEKDKKLNFIDFSENDYILSDKASELLKNENYSKIIPEEECLGTFASNALGRRYGFNTFSDYFLDRQLLFLITSCNLLNGLKEKTVDVGEADAIAAQSREIVRVIRSQQSILRQCGEKVTQELIEYATKE